MSRRAFSLCFVAASMLPAIAFSQSFLSQYKGLPYHDSRYQGGPQKIPGRVSCAYYDLGGEGVAYHDSDPQNHGSGELNPANGTYLNEFRIHEAVDTSYTKFNRKPDPIDDNPFDSCNSPIRFNVSSRRAYQFRPDVILRRLVHARVSSSVDILNLTRQVTRNRL